MSLETQGREASLLAILCTAATGTGAQPWVDVRGYNGAQEVELVATGTVAAQAVTVTIEGTFDQVNTYPVGYARVDSQGTLSFLGSAITLTPGNGKVAQVFAVRDSYAYLRLNIGANTLTTGLTAQLFMEPL